MSQPSQSSSSRSSHATAWVISLLLALPVIYVLSVPVIGWGIVRLTGAFAKGPWLGLYAKPFCWLRNETSLGGPLNRYESWCCEWICRPTHSMDEGPEIPSALRDLR